MQKQPNTKLRDLLRSKKAKTRKLSELSKTEQNRLAKLNALLDEITRGKNVQNRQLTTWLTEEENQSFESDSESQQQIREELKVKPSELQRYEDKLKEAIIMRNRSDTYHQKVRSLKHISWTASTKAYVKMHQRYFKKLLLLMLTCRFGLIEI